MDKRGDRVRVPDQSFRDIMERLRSGDKAAADEVYHRSLQRLNALAKRQFDSGIRHKADPEDVVQSALLSFFTRHERGDYDLADWEALWGLLAVITVRKCSKRRNHVLAARRDGRREVARNPVLDDLVPTWEAVDPSPTPVEAAMLAETLEQLFSGLRANDRTITELTIQGYTAEEISASLGCSERTVRRVRDRVKLRLRRLRGDEEALG